jgi:hypothetical protein
VIDDVRFYVLPFDGQGPPLEADRARVGFHWEPRDVLDALEDRGQDIAPGVRIAVFGAGDHWRAAGKNVYGVLVAVQSKGEQ